MKEQNIIDQQEIFDVLEKTSQKNTSEIIYAIFKKAKEKKGLNLEEVGFLLNLKDTKLIKKLFETASLIKDEIYGERLVFFAPLYISDFCVNDCEYCNFHVKNKNLKRKKLNFDEIEEQVKFLINMGHKRLLLEFGEDVINNPIDFVIEVIDKVYSVKTPKGNIRRVNVNIAATTVENYKKLKKADIGTYQLFQETYHEPTYKKMHQGPKADYSRQITAHLRAFEAGLGDVGLGVLFGLYDWKFEALALISHAQYLDNKINIGPHTISIPRFQSAQTVMFNPEYRVSDDDFLKLIAILRLAVPYTGIIITTRETPAIRQAAFKIGVSQTSACSVTSTGGYGKKGTGQQFETHDQRALSEIIFDCLEDNLLPSFCTACYRIGRTGEAFMDISKHGDIHNFCRPNAILTFAEYLEDFGTDEINKKGKEIVTHYLNQIENENMRNKTQEKLIRIKQGERDLFF